MSNELWSIYIAGPDDLVAMPSKAIAEAVARNFNAVWDRYGAERGHDVRAVPHVEPWMHGKEAHTKDLREHFYEYADLVLDEDAARFKPAQPVEAVGARSAFEAWARSEGYDCARSDLGGYSFGATHSAWKGWQAALAHPRPTGDDYDVARHNEWLEANVAPTGEQAGEVVHVEARRCDVCDHIGVNDASTTGGACHNCDWQGDEQQEDLCPGCGSHSCMAPACPECGGRYCLVASTEVTAQPRAVGVPDGWKLVPIDRAYIPEIDDPEQMECDKDTLTRAQVEAISQYKAKLNTKPNPDKTET